MANDLHWLYLEEEASKDVISIIESHWGIKLPEDYVECALINHGGTPSKDSFDFLGHVEVCLGELLSLDRSKSSFLLTVYENISDRLVERVYPFASDPGGNYICFDYRKKFIPSIVYWDHEIASYDPEGAITSICDSFSELLSKLYSIEL